MTTIQLPAAATTRSLLTCAVVAAPLWAVVSLAQAATRDGFDLIQQPLSMLSLGSLGWLQIANFLIAGVLAVAGAVGLRRVTDGWVPRLVATYGLGMIAAGVFTMDPMGAPMTWHSFGHMIAGTVSFASLIAVCHVLGRRYRRAGEKRLAIVSRVAGTVLLVGDLWAMSGGVAGSLTLAIGAITAMLWVSFVAAQYR
jgi:hypothetical protein